MKISWGSVIRVHCWSPVGAGQIEAGLERGRNYRLPACSLRKYVQEGGLACGGNGAWRRASIEQVTSNEKFFGATFRLSKTMAPGGGLSICGAMVPWSSCLRPHGGSRGLIEHYVMDATSQP
jgi:hypothetical protein